MRVLYRKLLLLLSFLQLLVNSLGESRPPDLKRKFCPAWMHLDSTNLCVCGDDLRGVISCDGNHLHIYKHYCILYVNEDNSTLIGSCPYSYNKILQNNESELKNDYILCGHLHRKGRLCGECEDNYSLPVYSYSLGCVHCKSFKYGWIKFITVAFLPLTVFYILVIIFRISATSSTLNGYVLVNQIIATPAVIQTLYTNNQVNPYFYVSKTTNLFVNLVIVIYTIWNLDFLRSFYSPICLHPHITYPQVLLLDYAVAVYPMLLIFITYLLVKMHDNYAFIVKLWRPFHRCLVIFRKQWNIQSSLVNALATFIVLSYVKILNVSFQLLIPSHVYNVYGETVHVAYLYYNGSITMTSKAYRPYLAIAVLMLLIFNIIPLLLLAVYPCRCFQRFFHNFCGCCLKYRIALQIFMDAFQGCYKDTPHDCRYFAAFYLALRLLNLLFYVLFNEGQYFLAASLLLVFTAILVTKLQPYKNKRCNTLDVVFFSANTIAYVSTTMEKGVSPMIPRLVSSAVTSISALIPPSVMAFVAISTLFPKASEYLVSCKRKLLERCCVGMTMSEEEQPILDCNRSQGANHQV